MVDIQTGKQSAMRPKGQTRRRWIVGSSAVLVAAFTAAAPFVLNVGTSEIEFEAAGVVAAARNTYTVADPIHLNSSIGITITGGQLGLAVPKGATVTGQKARELIEKGIADLQIYKGELSLGNPSASTAGHTTPAHPTPVLAALSQGHFATLRTSASTLSVTLPGGAVERLTNTNAHLTRIGRTGVLGSGNAVWRGQRISFSFKSDGTTDPSSNSVPVSLKLQGKLLSLSFDGRIGNHRGLQLKGDTELASSNIRRLARALGASWPDGPGLHDIRVSGPVNWAGTALAFANAKIKLDDNVGAGALSVSTAGSKALVTGTVAFDRFDIAPYLLDNVPAAAAPAATDDGWLTRLKGVWSMPVARLVDADIRVSIKKTRFGDEALGDAAATVTLKNGELLTNLAELSFGEGTVSGQMELNFNGLVPRMTVRGKLANVPVGPLSTFLFGKRYLDGNVSATTDLVMYGGTMRQMISSASGTIDIDMPKGGRAAVDMYQLDQRPNRKQAASPPIEQVFLRARGGSTALSRLKGSLLIAGGRVSTHDLQATYADRRAQLAGRADLTTRFVNLRVLMCRGPEEQTTTSSTTAADTQTASTKTRHGNLMLVKGDWRAPRVSLSKHKGLIPDLERLLDLSEPPPHNPM